MKQIQTLNYNSDHDQICDTDISPTEGRSKINQLPIEDSSDGIAAFANEMSCELSALTDSITSHGHLEQMTGTNVTAIESTLHLVSDIQPSNLLSTVSDKVVLHSQEHNSHDLNTYKTDSLVLDPVLSTDLEPKTIQTVDYKLDGKSIMSNDSSMKAVEIEDCMKYSSFVLDLDQSPDTPEFINDVFVKDQHDSTVPVTVANDSRTAVQNSNDSTSFNVDESFSEQQTPSINRNR